MLDEDNFEDAVESLTENLNSTDLSTKDIVNDVPENSSFDSISESRDSEVENDNFACPTGDNNSEENSEIVIDEAVLKELEARMSDEEKEVRRKEAQRLKEIGNVKYNEGQYEAAVQQYTDALTACLLFHTSDRAILYANRAAAKVKLDKKESAIEDCTKALEFNPDHMKARLRRADLYEKTEKLDEALEDYTKAVEQDPTLHIARAACMRLPDQIKDRNEKMKEEMLGKLKDLGNMILRPFGLSTENFKLQQDPVSGSYSVNFQQQQPSSSSSS